MSSMQIFKSIKSCGRYCFAPLFFFNVARVGHVPIRYTSQENLNKSANTTIYHNPPHYSTPGGNTFLTYFVRPIYCMINERRTTPKVKVAIRFFRLLLISSFGKDATSATDSAPLIPPSTTMCLQVDGIFSRVNLLTIDSIGYVEVTLAKNIIPNAKIINPIF